MLEIERNQDRKIQREVLKLNIEFETQHDREMPGISRLRNPSAYRNYHLANEKFNR